MNEMLVVKDLSVRHKDNQVLNGLDFNLDHGEILALLGESGCGKSSTLRFIAGLDNAENGSIELDGLELSVNGEHQITPEFREIGMVFQDFALFPHMNVEKNIAFGLNSKTKTEQQERVSELLSLIGLTGIEKKYPHQLSGGEQQRVALARSLAPSPKLLLLDEVFSSLSAEYRNKLASEVRKILKESKTTSILVTHDKHQAHTFADKIGTIKNKKLEYS